MMKNFSLVPVLTLLLSNATYADTAGNVNELISTAAKEYSRIPPHFENSLSLNQQALVIADKVQTTSPLLLFRVLTQKMELLIKSSQLDQAQKVCSQIFALREIHPQLTGPSYANFLHVYAELLLLQGKLAEAERASLQAIEIFGKNGGSIKATRLDEEFAFLGKVYVRQREWDKAENYLRLAVYLNKVKREFGLDNSYKKNAVLDLIKVYQETKRDDLAKQVEVDMKEVLNPPNTVWQMVLNQKYKAPELVKESCKNPPFPPETSRYAMEGSMSLKFLIAEDGEVVGKYASMSSDWKRLDDMALYAIAQCKFNVGTYEGRPVTGWAYYNYDWKANPGGKPYPKPELIESSYQSDIFDMEFTTAKPQDNEINFKIDVDGKPYGFSGGNFKNEGNLYGELVDILEKCRFKPTVIDGETRGNRASVRFVRKQLADKNKVSLSQ
ncbi:energy transducer TonB [Undibacterium pigrum]|uniref:TonB-like protein n=1 Tax=Undibacterium pigrum TaxID=401470 RepID=A0A318IM36_9BURK|nr:energy transducer TonB [Undibacterium pigrum]PXX34930.1 TonB-like protein [Undibacterium pigrum]